MRLRDSPEFRRIRSLVQAAGAPPSADVSVGPGDDAAVFRPERGESLVLSTDLSVENVHFRREWMTWTAIGYRSAAAALSDLAAMSARPIGVLLSVAVPPELDGQVLDEIAGGVGSCLRELEGALLGGDLSSSPGPVVVDVAAVGVAERPVRRSGAAPGDELWVTGRLGGAALAATAWDGGLEPEPSVRRAFERPAARVREARLLCAEADVHAMIDLSDGLAADAEQLAVASGVRVRLRRDRIPLHRALSGWADPGAALTLAAGGGEDYELLFAAAPGSVSNDLVRRVARSAEALTRVGVVEAGAGVVWVDVEGRTVDAPGAPGFDHFERGPR